MVYIISKQQQEQKKHPVLDPTSDNNSGDSGSGSQLYVHLILKEQVDKQYSRPCFDEIYLLFVFLGTICFIVLKPIPKILFQPLDFDCILDCGSHGYSICILLFSLQLNFWAFHQTQ